MAFDLISVVYSSLAVGTPVVSCWPLLIYFILFGGTYVYYHKLNAAVRNSVNENNHAEKSIAGARA